MRSTFSEQDVNVSTKRNIIFLLIKIKYKLNQMIHIKQKKTK